MSIDGISALDMVSRAAMLDGLYTLVGGEALPFVRAHVLRHAVVLHVGRRGRCGRDMARRRWRAG